MYSGGPVLERDEGERKQSLKSKTTARVAVTTQNKNLCVSIKLFSGGPVFERDEGERKQTLKSKTTAQAVVPTLNIMYCYRCVVNQKPM